ncbi:hypothetical protein PP556_14555 [Mycobacteroides abscessus]|nr:hypothetical protein [Mycobacteroides abscessus]MDM2451150.1 hypothetical protein [Mycobacteroides abscessus]MDM2455704.1 hypothetical protein [Mycobacteroides abscessus]MDM2460456.1 hypothetical protein [Mycobacteroides abscessus]MDM2466112.1 hypothetical protein [Mycobacteroides abscessus]
MTTTSTSDAVDCEVIAFPGTIGRYVFRSGVEFKWHCPFCHESGRYVKRLGTAIRGLGRHVERRHP